ncbi:MAG: hypothetical protein MUF64_16660, partial [Polyangiaceae bacterium]|nr:hypothetical protein [Polyangiaceae bacterium]
MMTPEPIIPLLREAEAQLEQLRPGPDFEARLQLRLRQQVDLRRKRGQGRLLLLLAAGGALVVGASLLDPDERKLQPIPWLLPPPPLSAAASSSAEPPPPPSPEPLTPDLPRADLQRVPLRVATREATPADKSMEVPYPQVLPSRGLDSPEPAPGRPPTERGKGEHRTLARAGSEATEAQEPAALLAPGVVQMQLAPGSQPRAVQASQPGAGSPRSTAGGASPAQPGPVQGPSRALPPANQGTTAPAQPRSGPENATPAATYRGCFPDLVRRKIDTPPDGQSCEGPSFVRWSSEQNLWVGAVSCGDGSVRLYLAESEQGPFLPALDIAGHGQDHCELLVPGFTLGNEDDIASGSCASCSTGPNIAIEGKAGYV